MAWNGLGTFNLDPAFSPEINGNIIDAVRYNGLFTDLAVGLTAALARNGENVPSANLPMAGFKHTGAAAATATGQYLTWGQSALVLARRIIITADYTVTLADQNSELVHLDSDTTPRTVTIPANATIAFPVGTFFQFHNEDATGAITLTLTTDQFYLEGWGLVSTYSLPAGASVRLTKINTTFWKIETNEASLVRDIITGTRYDVGFRDIPQNSKSADYTLVLADRGKHIYHPSADTTARVWTIPANASVAFPVGSVVSFDNDSGAGDITIAITSDTLRWAGSASTGSRTLAANGSATALKITTTSWKISGAGLT